MRPFAVSVTLVLVASELADWIEPADCVKLGDGMELDGCIVFSKRLVDVES